MRHIVVGTAGHIDHGKTALVRALTGVDTDRLEEEKRRGISIDLGFAHFDPAPGLRVAFIDVPGHERFIKNMLAGVGGIDLVMLIVAGDESIKPQTREHFQICRLLQIPRGLVVITKSDLVDKDIAELVRLEIEEFVQDSFLEGAPIVPVSSITGDGLADLRQQLVTIGESAPVRDADQYLRLPLDRAFTLHGFGTVVAGTLRSGELRTEQEVVAQPGNLPLRVRSIQVHGKSVKRAFAGQRTALNVTGADVEQLRRGLVITEPGRFAPTQTIDCQFNLLPHSKPLRARVPVHFHAGTAEVEANLRHLASTEPIQPGSTSFVRLQLKEPVLLLPGDRFIVRRFSPVETIGGGAVIDIAPPRVRQKETLTRLTQLAKGSLAERLTQFVSESAFGLSLAQLVARTGATERAIQAAVKDTDLLVLPAPHHWFIGRQWLQQKASQLQLLLADFHKGHPLQAGLAKEDARRRLMGDAPAFLMDVLLQHASTVTAEADLVRLKSHRVSLQQDEQEALAKIESLFQQAGLSVPVLADVLAQSGVDAARSRSLLQALLRQQKLIRIGEDLVFHHTALTELRHLLAAHAGQRFSIAEFKDWTGISRKYAIPLLEYLDRLHITRRDGDSRVVR